MHLLKMCMDYFSEILGVIMYFISYMIVMRYLLSDGPTF